MLERPAKAFALARVHKYSVNFARQMRAKVTPLNRPISMNNNHTTSIDSYTAFWRFYLREHANLWTRRWHIAGTLSAMVFLIAAIALFNPWLLLAALLVGYGPAWLAHFFVEKNHPATWRYPLWSLASDIRMTVTWLTGNLWRELRNAGID